MDKHKEKQRHSCMQRAAHHIRRHRCGTASLLLLAVGALGLLMLQSGGMSWLTDSPISQPGRVLLVTAHPDDEVIFFSSSVTALHAAGAEVFLLCLTSGASALLHMIAHDIGMMAGVLLYLVNSSARGG